MTIQNVIGCCVRVLRFVLVVGLCSCVFQQSAAVHGTTIDARMQQVLEASRKSTGSPALNLNAFSLQVGGAPPVVTTLAGGGSGNYADGAGTSAAFHYPWGLAYDSSGLRVCCL